MIALVALTAACTLFFTVSALPHLFQVNSIPPTVTPPISLESINAGGPIVNLTYGRYQGQYDATTNTTSFLGVRFAASPEGNLRWQAPQAPQPFTETQQATAHGAQCPQLLTSPSDAPYGMSEDCLFLDVCVPGDMQDQIGMPEYLPVIVYIHGGGFTVGASYLYNGTGLVQQSNYQAIVVVPQYRLNVFGFLAGTAVMQSGVANAGLLDQSLALQWVQDNIAAFGGAPSKVTIWGGSAGANSVVQHMISQGNGGNPLFHGVITNSIYLATQDYYNDPHQEALYNDVVTRANCQTASDSLACLRAADPQVFDYWINVNGSALSSFLPVVDGAYVTRTPYQAFAQGDFKGDMLLCTTNTNEGVLYANVTYTSGQTIKQYLQSQLPQLSEAQVTQVLGMYAQFGSDENQAIQLGGEVFLKCPTYQLMKAFSGKRVWKGELAVPPALHGEEIPYMFPPGDKPAPAGFINNTQLIDEFVQPFLSFAVAGDPNQKFVPPNALPFWANWDETPAGVEMQFNVTENMQPDVRQVTTDAELLHRCDYWFSMANVTLQ